MQIRGLILAWILAVHSLASNAESLPTFIEPIVANGRPRTVAEVLVLVRRLAESGACARAEFYSVSVMHALLGEDSDAEAKEYEHRITAGTHGLQELVTADDDSTKQSPYLRGIWLEARRPKVEHGWEAACYLTATFWGEMTGLDYPSVKAVLGEGERDQKAEMARDLHIAIHPWNKPIIKRRLGCQVCICVLEHRRAQSDMQRCKPDTETSRVSFENGPKHKRT